MKSVSGMLLICLILLLTGCSSEGEESVGPKPAPTITPAPPDETAVAEITPTESMKPEEEKVPLPPFDEEKMAQNLKDAGAVFAKIDNGVLTMVNCFKSKVPVTDETIKHLVDAHGRTSEYLVYLNLYGANLTDESLKIIARIPSLESLNLNNVSGDMTSQGISSMVESLPNLTTLGLSDSRITNEGLKPVGSLKNLDQLVLAGTDIGDQGLVHLKNLKNMETMNLRGTKVTDEGLIHLTALPKLKHLTLSATEITGAGAVEYLKKLTNLESLSVPRENFEKEHYDALKAANPKLWK